MAACGLVCRAWYGLPPSRRERLNGSEAAARQPLKAVGDFATRFNLGHLNLGGLGLGALGIGQDDDAPPDRHTAGATAAAKKGTAKKGTAKKSTAEVSGVVSVAECVNDNGGNGGDGDDDGGGNGGGGDLVAAQQEAKVATGRRGSKAPRAALCGCRT